MKAPRYSLAVNRTVGSFSINKMRSPTDWKKLVLMFVVKK